MKKIQIILVPPFSFTKRNTNPLFRAKKTEFKKGKIPNQRGKTDSTPQKQLWWTIPAALLAHPQPIFASHSMHHIPAFSALPTEERLNQRTRRGEKETGTVLEERNRWLFPPQWFGGFLCDLGLPWESRKDWERWGFYSPGYRGLHWVQAIGGHSHFPCLILVPLLSVWLCFFVLGHRSNVCPFEFPFFPSF